MQKGKHEYASNEAEAKKLGYTWQEYMDKVYADCLEKERQRDSWKSRSTPQGAFESGFIRYDAFIDDEDAEDKLPLSSSLGETISGAERNEILRDRAIKLKRACEKLRRNKMGYLVKTLLLIAKNGKNREKTIWEMAIDSLSSAAKANGSTSITGKSSASTSRPKSTRK